MKSSFEIRSYSGSFKIPPGICGGQGAFKMIKALLAVAILLLNTEVAKALPSYARQTGKSCSACHFSFPELNSFGRQFKMNGFILTDLKTSELKGKIKEGGDPGILKTVPLSVEVLTTFNHIAKDVTATQNNTVAFPQQLSLFIAGQVAPHFGTFIQMTYDGHVFGMDNVDIRYSNKWKIFSKNLVYGLTLNNNPTVQDGWNSSSSWKFPSAGSDAARLPAKSAIVENLGARVAGAGLYTLFNDLIFGEVTLYRSAQQGIYNPANSKSVMVISDIGKYARLAVQHKWTNNYAELGAFGFETGIYPLGVSGTINKFTDIGINCHYERTFRIGTATLHSSYIRETEDRQTSFTGRTNINFDSFKIDGNFYFKNILGATAGYFASLGSKDSNVVSWSNKPDTSGYMAQLEYLPWFNTKIALQYISFTQFNGTMYNYDNKGRNASDNNTLYLVVWLNF